MNAILSIVAIAMCMSASFGLTYGLIVSFLDTTNSLALKSAFLAVMAQCMLLTFRELYEKLRQDNETKERGAK